MEQATAVRDCVETFAQATQDVMDQILDEKAVVGEAASTSSPFELLEVNVILGLTGDLEGRVMFEFNQADALRYCQVMNYGEEFSELDSLARSTLSELGNLIAGRAVTIIHDQGGRLSISPPILMCGMGVRASDLNPVNRFPVRAACGEMYVNLSFRSTNKSNGRVR